MTAPKLKLDASVKQNIFCYTQDLTKLPIVSKGSVPLGFGVFIITDLISSFSHPKLQNLSYYYISPKKNAIKFG